MELHERSVLLFERWDVALPHQDPKGRDRLLSCGAALENLRLAGLVAPEIPVRRR